MTSRISSSYDALVSSGALARDPAQAEAIAALDRLAAQLADHRLGRKSSALGWLFARHSPTPPRGLYIWGEVGRGKTMLMDLFHEAAPVRRKRRAHFNAFMTDVHARIHVLRQAMKEGRAKSGDPIIPVADELADEAWLLCFDEFQVTDIADAMILGRLFERLFERGVVVVATSNVEPDQLYRDGLNRSLFLPFIGMLRKNMNVLRLDVATDYRLDKLQGVPVWLSPDDTEAAAAMDTIFNRMIGAGPARPMTLQVQGREVAVPRAALGVARFSFADLCSRPLAAADYLAVADRFHTVFLDSIPLLPAERRNETKRFILLIDTFYDRHVKLIASAAAEPEALIGDGNYHAFEFQRTVSRLTEMRSEAWMRAPHGPVDAPHDPGTGGLVET